MSNSAHKTMTRISAYALLTGISTISLSALTNTAHASTETQISHINTVSQVASSKISLITIPNATTSATSAPVHHSFLGSIISGIGHAIKDVVHTAGSIISGIGHAITGVTHTVGSVIKTIPKVIVSGIFTVAHALASPLNIAVSLGKTGLGILSQGVSFFGNIASSVLSIVSSAGGFIPDFGITSAVTGIVSSAISLGTTVISNVAQLASQYIPPVIYGAENLVFGIGHGIASAVGNAIGGTIGGTIGGIGSIIGGGLSGIGHVLTNLTATSPAPTAIRRIVTPAVSAPISAAIIPPKVSLLG